MFFAWNVSFPMAFDLIAQYVICYDFKCFDAEQVHRPKAGKRAVAARSALFQPLFTTDSTL